MNINLKLFKECELQYIKDDYFYSNCQNDISDFLLSDQERAIKQDNAINIMQHIMKEHKKKPLLEYLLELAKVERKIKNV